MTWQSPWSWLGLLVLALPIVIHLLGRGRSVVQRFPTLRFIETSRLLPTRRTRLHDLALLAVRLGVLLAAVAALAQPLLRTASRRRATGQSLARVIVVDTTASMRRLTPNGDTAILAARREATKLAAEAQASAVIAGASLGDALPGAVAWLAHQVGRGEVVLVSDFQLGSVDGAAIAAVPGGIGVRLVRIPVVTSSGPVVLHSRRGPTVVAARVNPDSGRTDVFWSANATAAIPVHPQLLGGEDELAGIAAASSAAQAVGLPVAIDSGRPVAIVFPHASARAQLIGRAGEMRAPWMTTLAARLLDDPLLAVASKSAAVEGAIPVGPGLVLARDAFGEALVTAAADSGTTQQRLLLFARVDAASPLSAALIAAVTRALDVAPPAAELEPRTIADALLAAWQRAPSESAGPGRASDPEARDSDGRWFWLAALLLLALEGWLRRGAVVTPIVSDAVV